jgi:hypothetical protein
VRVGETGLWSKDVQRLLWAAGEARARARERRRPVSRTLAEPALPAGGDFFTEWQPTTG